MEAKLKTKKYVEVVYTRDGRNFPISGNPNYAYVSETYEYSVDFKCTKGDFIVVPVKQENCERICIVRVEEVSEITRRKTPPKQAICLIPMEKYHANKALFLEQQKLIKQMDAEVAKLKETALYELMADKSPELASMLKRFKELGGK